MVWRPYQDVYPRWSHVGASLVATQASATPEGTDAEVVVRFYPWWEHPGYLALVRAAKPCRFGDVRAATRDVRVRGIGVVGAGLQAVDHVPEWSFRAFGARAWEFEQRYPLFVNAGYDRDALLERVARRAKVQVHALARWIGEVDETPASIGAIPASIYLIVREELDAYGALPFVPKFPDLSDDLVTFECAAGWIVARDFHVDVPDFDHARVVVEG